MTDGYFLILIIKYSTIAVNEKLIQTMAAIAKKDTFPGDMYKDSQQIPTLVPNVLWMSKYSELKLCSLVCTYHTWTY